jgi:ribonuclease P protein component
MGTSYGRERKISKKADFWGDRGRRKRFETEHFRLILRKNNKDVKRLGLAVGKKAGGAVSRNRIKRLVREFFRLNRERMPESSDLIVLAKENIEIDGYREVFDELRVILG